MGEQGRLGEKKMVLNFLKFLNRDRKEANDAR